MALRVFRTDKSRLARYAHTSIRQPTDPSGADDRGEPQSSRSEPVQPETAEHDAETLVDPAPDRCFADIGGMADLTETIRRTVVDDTNGYATSDLALLADNAARKAMRADDRVRDRHLLEAVAETEPSIETADGNLAADVEPSARGNGRNTWYNR